MLLTIRCYYFLNPLPLEGKGNPGVYFFLYQENFKTKGHKKTLLEPEEPCISWNMLSAFSDLSFPSHIQHAQKRWSWHLINCMIVCTIGCQGFFGPFPSAFLDKKSKELAQRYIQLWENHKFILNFYPSNHSPSFSINW